MARKRKGSKPRKTAKRKTTPKARAKRRSKPLVKAPKVQRARGKKKQAARAKKHEPRVKFVKRKLDAVKETQILSLIARVYKRAAEEMREMEQNAIEQKVDLMKNAADEMLRLAEKYEKT